MKADVLGSNGGASGKTVVGLNTNVSNSQTQANNTITNLHTGDVSNSKNHYVNNFRDY